MAFRIIPRKEWAERNVSLSPMSRPQSRVFIHHTVSHSGPSEAEEKAHMNQLERFHMDSRGFKAIAYSFVVFPSGRVYAGRGWDKAGGHTLNFNSISHAVCFVGNFENEQPTRAAIDSARRVIEKGIQRGSISKPPHIQGHRDVGTTACPGQNLYDRLDEIRKPRVLPRRFRVRRPSGEWTAPISRKRAMEIVRNLSRKLARGKDILLRRTR